MREEADGTAVDMAEWLPWQNSLQQTSLFGHSRRSQHLVELLEFTDLQRKIHRSQQHKIHRSQQHAWESCTV